MHHNKKRIAIDMDDVMADTTARRIEWYERDFNIKLDRTQWRGMNFHDAIPLEHQPITRQYSSTKGFFQDLKIMPHSQAVIQELQSQYEIFIVTAATPFPNSFNEKYDWLQAYFPFINCMNYVFCGHKYMIQTDYLIDDASYNLAAFPNKSLLFTAPHNYHEKRFTRLNNWLEVKAFFGEIPKS